MNIQEIKELMMQFNQSDIREFTFKSGKEELHFSKNERPINESQPTLLTVTSDKTQADSPISEHMESLKADDPTVGEVSGELVESPLVGIAYLSPGPGKDNFVTVGDQVKKGQTLMIIEAMKVMNEIPAPKDGVITEILVDNEEILEFGKGLVRIK